jgi:TRAP-type C4-dicarboxylate transport system substrate-binding protein
MKKIFYGVLISTLIIGFCVVIQPTNAAEPMVLKASCFLEQNHPIAVKVFTWIDTVNKELKGELSVKFVGGPEVVPVFEQIEAVRKGIIQISFTSGAHYATRLPAANALHISRLFPWEERKSGFFDLMAKEHEKLEAKLLGKWFWGPFWMWLKDPIKTPDELRGKRLRTHPMYDRFYKALGISGVTLQPSDIYTSLEKGMVDGTSWPIQGPREQGWLRAIKYIIEHPYYEQNNTVMVMKLDVWNKLSESTKAKIEKITIAFEPEMVRYFQNETKKEFDLVIQAGVNSIKFSPSDAKRFVDLAYEVEWAELSKKIPDLVPALRKTSGN